MTDAVSTIGLGVDTAEGLARITSLREEFAGLRKEVEALNSLKANAQGLSSGAQTAQNELATLGAELKSSTARVNELEEQIKRLGKAQVDSARATTQAIKTETKAQFDVQVTSEKNLANEIAKIAEKSTAKVKEEAAKRAAISANGIYGGIKYSVSEKVDPGLAETSIIKAKLAEQARIMETYDLKRLEAQAKVEAEHRAMMFEGLMKDAATEQERVEITRLAAEARLRVERELQQKREVLMASAGMKATLAENGEGYKQKLAGQNQEYQLYLLKQREYAQRHRELEQTFREADKTAESLKLKEQAQQYQEFLMKQAIHLKEWKEIEALIASDDKEANRIKLLAENQQYQEYLAKNRSYTEREAEITSAMRKAEEQEYKLHLMRQAEDAAKFHAQFNAERKSTILDNNFNTSSLNSRVTTTRRAAGLVNGGETGLAHELYGSAAVSAVSNLTQMEAQLLAQRRNGTGAVAQAAAAQRVHTESMRDAHSAARGLAGGLGQLWVTYGSVIPLVAGAAVTGSMVKVYSAGKDVEYQLQFLRALADDLEKRPIDLDSFLKITDGTMASVKDASGGMRALAQAGLDQQKALVALPNILDLATIGEMSVGQAALTATGVVHAFGLELNDIGHVGDVFAKVAASSNTSVAGMTESMKSASTVGEMFHVSMEQAAASIGVLAQRNITGTSAGTALTTALKNLYEPTAKADAALKAMNITTDDGHGGLKDYTQLLTELREKLSGLNDSSKAVFLGTITDQRGAKAISAITENLKEYKKFLGEAQDSTGFMSKATLELEDTVQGSFQRMSNTMEGSFIQAFKQASPTIREVLADLTRFGKSEGTVELISRLAVAAANLTKTLVEHAGAIAYTVLAYAGFKVLSTALNGYVSLRAAIALNTLTTQASTVANTENAVALTLEQQAALAAGRGMIVAGTAARYLTAAFGPISLIVMAAVTAYELFHSKIESSDNAMKAANNTADTVLDYYQRQIEKLRELNKELSDFSTNGTKAANDTARAVLQAQFLGKSVELQKLKDSGQDKAPVSFAQKALVGDQAQTKGQQVQAEMKAIGDKLLDLDTKAKELEASQGLNKKLNSKKGVETRLEQLIRDAGGDEADPAGNAATKLMLPKILALKDQLKSGTEAYKDVATKIVDYRKELNEKLGTFVAPKKGGESDAYRAEQAKLDAKLQEVKDREKSKLSDVKSNLDSHEIGDLQAIAQNLAIVKQARQDELGVLREKEALAKGEDKKAATQQILNKEAANRRADAEADKDADRQRRELAARWSQDSLKAEADDLRKRGELRLAFEKEFDGKHGGEIAGLDKDIKSGTLAPQDLMNAVSRKGYLEKERDTGSKAASFSELQDQYDKLHNQMNEQLASVSEKASSSNGFLSDVGAAQAADDIRTKLTPALDLTLAQMGQIANGLNDNAMKASVSKMSTTLIKESNRSREAWVAVGKSIEKSLGDAFGKGGKAAGGIVSALIKQREAQKDIDADLAKAKKDDPEKAAELEAAARDKSAQLQISSYGEIAGAAKGFFDEHSKGYAAMQAAEKVFRAFELAEALRSFLTKSGLTTAFMGLFATAKTEEVALTAATVAPTIAAEGAKQTAFSVTALAGALALPFPANLPAFAIVAAMLAAIGIGVAGASGGGGQSVDLSKERQKYTGTGYTYNQNGDNPYEWELQKSESLSKSLERMKDNSDIALRYSSEQLATLDRINAGIAGMASAVMQTTGIRGTKADEAALGVGSSKSFLAFSGSKTSLDDSGIYFDPVKGTSNYSDDYLDFLGMKVPRNGGSMLSQNLSQTIGSVLSGGVNAHSYADTTTESKSWWGLSSSTDHNTKYGNLDNDLMTQMNLVVKGLYSTVTDAAKFFGKDGNTIQQLLQGVTLREAGLDKISLKGLSSDEVEKTLNAAFSKLGDIMAERALPGLKDFQKAGEGYLDTLLRVSTGIDSAQYSLERLGVTMVDYTKVVNKQGDVASEVIRQSLALKEGATGIAGIIESFSGSASDMVDTYSKLVGIRNTMRVTGMKNADVTTSMVRGAGGLDNLQSGMNDFLDNFFTDAEKAAAKVTLLQEEFVKIGQPMPKSKEEFKALANSIDRTTESGQTLYGALIALAGQFSDVADSTGAVSPALQKQKAIVSGLIDTAKHWLDIMGSAKGLVDDLNDALDETGKSDRTARISELRDLLNSGVGSFEQQLEIAGQLKDLVLEKYQTEKENAEEMIKFGKDLNKYVTDLKTGDLSPLTNKGKLEAAVADYQKTYNDTQSSDKTVRDDARSDIQDKSSTLLELAHTYFASSQGYTDIFNEVTNQLTSLGMSSLDSGKSLEDLSNDQISELQKLRDLAKNIEAAATGEYESSVNQLAVQIGLMQNMDGSLGMLVQLFGGMPAQLAMALGNKGVSLPDYATPSNTAKDQIESMYNSILHRKSDSEGLLFWLNAYQKGLNTMDEIRSLIANSPEARGEVKYNGSHANGLDYVPFDGYVAQLHRGERVLTATESRRMDKAAMASTASFSADERAQMAAEIAELRKTMERMVEAQEEGTKAMVRAMGVTSEDNADRIVNGTKDALNSSDYDNRNKPAFQ